MMKEYFDLNKQIVHLAIDKSVMFEHAEISAVKEMLYDNNYRNFVSCSKIKYAELIGSDLIMYRTASFKEWKSYFKMDCRISKYLMGNLIDFERTINSRISHQISVLMASNQLSNFERNTIVQIIRSSQRKKLSLKNGQNLVDVYNGQNTWEFITKMTFGEMKQLLFWLFDYQREIYLEIVKGYRFLQSLKCAKKRINEINRMRNNLFHFRPLNVYITHGSSAPNDCTVLNNKFRKEAVDFVLRLRNEREISLEVKQIFEHSDHYVKIKNSQRMSAR